MDRFDCPECMDEGYLTCEVEVTESETHDGVTTYRGECPEHGSVSDDFNWGNP